MNTIVCLLIGGLMSCATVVMIIPRWGDWALLAILPCAWVTTRAMMYQPPTKKGSKHGYQEAREEDQQA